jgi:2-amino-4-hydroxy-6-hydroxymethyldihydropteridine diphosphokinase
MAERRVRAYVALGANVGDARATLAAAVRTLSALPGARLVAVSRLYATRPVGVTDQPDFLNAAVALDVPAGPDPETGALALLVAMKQLEHAFGRK